MAQSPQPPKRPTGGSSGRSTRRVGGMRPAGGPVPPPVPAEAGGPAQPGRRGGVPPGQAGEGLDKRIIYGGVAGGILIVVVLVAFHFAGKKDAPEKTGKGEETEKAGDGDRFPDASTPEGMAKVKEMFETPNPPRLRKYIQGISPETAIRIKEILVPYLMRLDTGISFDDAYNICLLLPKAKDERVLSKILDLGMKKKDAHSLLAAYGAMGAQGVIARATADDGTNTEIFVNMLRECRSEEAVEPIKAAAETSEKPMVAWICGDALYLRRIPISLARVQSWLADTNARAQASGVRQMAVQKDTDRDAALMPFTQVEAALDARMALGRVVADDKEKKLSRDLMRNLLKIDDLEFFEEMANIVAQNKMFEYIGDLESIRDSSMGTARGRTAGRVAQQLRYARGEK